MNFKIGDIVNFQQFKNAVVASNLIDVDFDTTGILLCVNSKPGWHAEDEKRSHFKVSHVAKSYANHKPSNTYWFVPTPFIKDIKPVVLRFKNSAAITGPIHLINAFAEVSIELGWKIHRDEHTKNSPGLYFNAKKEALPKDLQPQHFWYTGQDQNFNVTHYRLPQDWDKALATISEKEEEKPVEISGYTAEVKNNTVAFGCQQFTIEQLETYQDLLERKQFGVNAKITINDTDITSDMIGKLLKMIKNK